MGKPAHDHVIAVAVTYDALRTALVRPDTLSDDSLRSLIDRTKRAAKKYPDEGGPAQAAENGVLWAYARYLELVLSERDQAVRAQKRRA